MTVSSIALTKVALNANSDATTITFTYTLSNDPGHSAGVQTKTISKTLTYAKSSNQQIIDNLNTKHGSTGSTNLYAGTGTTVIANTPPTTISESDLKTLLVANGVTASGT